MPALAPVLIPVRAGVAGAAALGPGSRRAPFNGRGEELGAFKNLEGGAGKPGMREGKAGGTDGKPGSGERQTPGRPENRGGGKKNGIKAGKPGGTERKPR